MWAIKTDGTVKEALNFRARFFKQDERGSLTIFALFIFIAILTICGVAVDMMNYEKERIGVQNTLDTAVVAATSLNQDANTNAAVTALVKDYFAKAGYDPDIVDVTPNIEIPAGGSEETLRTVSAVVDYDLDTMFLNMVGINRLPGAAGGGAREGQQLIEVALVLDISGSMGWNNKLQNMKNAAKEFVTLVLDNNGADRVMISIIPYNQQVHMNADLVNRITWENPLTQITPAPTHPGAIEQYFKADSNSRCARFLDADYDSRRLAAGPGLERSANFSRWIGSYNQPDGNDWWCGQDNDYPEMMLYQNDELTLHNFIDSLTARGMTAIDYGMKWATGVLDPSFRPIVQGMLADTNNAALGVNLVPQNVAGHPVDYGEPNVFKYIVLMTDGANTQHLDLKDEFKSGPSRVWYSVALSEEFNSSGAEYDGYLVEMPDNNEATRWYRPRSPWTNSDDSYLSETEFQALTDPEQWLYPQIYDRFSVRDAADYFFQYSDWPARQAHRNAEVNTGGYGTADTNLWRICDQAQQNGWIDVYAVAFEAPSGGVNALQTCVSNAPGKFFDVAGTQISDAFSVIASEITKLRLTQ